MILTPTKARGSGWVLVDEAGAVYVHIRFGSKAKAQAWADRAAASAAEAAADRAEERAARLARARAYIAGRAVRASAQLTLEFI